MANFRNIVISSSGTGGTLVWPTGTLAMGGLILTGAGAINGITLSGTAATFTLATSAAVTLTGPVQVSFSGFGTLDTSISVGKTLTLAAADNYTLTATASGNIYVSGGTDVTPADGGTGVSNNAASTITISGAYALTLTLTGTTGVTLPTTGTLATLAGTETLSGKTLTSPVLTTPTLGTPASGVLTNCTGLPVAGGGTGVSQIPKFHATITGDQTIATATYTKVTFNTEDFDVNSNYDPTTNYRFTAPVAGKYMFGARLYFGNSATAAAVSCYLYKNGSAVERFWQFPGSSVINLVGGSVLVTAAANDYFEIYVWHNAVGDLTITSGATISGFWGTLIP